MMTFDQWKEKFDELPLSTQLSIYNEKTCEDIYEVDSFEFGVMFDGFESLLLSVCNGDVDPAKPYFKFDVYGYMESLSESDVKDMIEDSLEEIYDEPDCWERYIENDEEN